MAYGCPIVPTPLIEKSLSFYKMKKDLRVYIKVYGNEPVEKRGEIEIGSNRAQVLMNVRGNKVQFQYLVCDM